jgi:hypothetical protein
VNPPTPTDEYSHGQLMGMLCIIRLLKLKGTVPAEMVDRIERYSYEHLALYLEKPEEDIMLLIDKQLENI